MGNDQILLDPLRGETFRLSAYVSASTSSGLQRNQRMSVGQHELTIASMSLESVAAHFV